MASIAFLFCFCVRTLHAAPPPATTPGAAQNNPESRGSGASASDAAAKADVLLAEAEIWVSELETAVKGGADGSGCPPNFNLRSFLRDRKEKRGAKEIGDEIPDPDGHTKVEWEFYTVCNALAAKSPAPCSEVGDIARKEGGKGLDSYSKGVAGNGAAYTEYVTQKDKCGASYLFMRSKIAAAARDANFPAVCRESAPAMPPMKSPASVDAICTAWQGGDAAALANAVSAGVKTPLKPEYARDVARELLSDPAWCAATDQDDAKLGCQEINDYRSALAKKDAKACRGGLCRMLMGGGAASCEPYAQKIKKQLCTRYYRTKFSDDRGPLIEERLKIAETFIAGAAGKVTDLREAQSFSDRLDRVYALRDRLNSAVLVLSPLGTKPAKGAVKQGGKTTK